MSTIKAVSITKEKVKVNFHVIIDNKNGSGYESTVTIESNGCDGWTASMDFEGMPLQESPEQAIDRMGLYLREMSKAMKGKNIKHLNISKLFEPVHR